MLENQEFIQDFIEEAVVHVENVESGLLKLDENCQDPENINTIFRAVHSMKGTAGFFGLKNIVSLSHCMENVFGEVRNNSLQLDKHAIDLLLSANDCLKSMIKNIETSEDTDISGYIRQLSVYLKKDAPPAPRQEPVAAGDHTASEASKTILEASVKHGHRLFKVQLRINEDLGKKGINPVLFFKKIESIGIILDTYTDTSDVQELDEVFNGEIRFVFLFTTVLEKALLPLALEIPVDCIEELDPAGSPYNLSELAKNSEPPEEKVTAPAEKTAAPGAKQPQGIGVEDSIRVHVSLLNNILNLASEMVLGRNQLLRSVDKYRKNIPGLDPILQNIDRITTEMQEKVMQTRMQPISNVFSKFPRIIRELSKKLEKEMELQLEGSEVELDKSIIEALTDPLTHLVRNAADHGLEKPDTREARKKPRTGTITLKAYHEGGYVNIDIVDDGAGIDLEKIKKKALEKEIVTKSEIAAYGEKEILQLLFKPGFSTAEKVTDVSGRGVGMDVVKTNIEKLGGTIEIFTVLGQGTTFRLLLPLTLAIIPSLIVEVEQQKFALPQINLQEIVRIKPGDPTRRIEYIHDSEVLRLRGRLLPIVHLSDVLGLQRTYLDSATGQRKTDRRKSFQDQRQQGPEGSNFCRRENSEILRILVLKLGSKRFGIAVDLIHGSEETLVKPLPVYLKDAVCYSGVTILGDGKAAMILDPDGIIEKGNLRFSEDQEDAVEKELSEASNAMKEQQSILLFKCSGSETFGIDLSLVSRVEEIHPGDIEEVGDKQYIQYRGDSLRIIRPEDYLPVTRGNNEQTRQYIVIPKLVRHPIGILIERIIDTVHTSIRLNEEDIQAEGLLGSTILQNRLVLLLNMYELFEKAAPEHFHHDTAKYRGEGKTILVAEDTPFFQKLERNYFEEAGYRVVLAQNGKEALQLLQENPVDILVSDINMPVMDGLELIKRVRDEKKWSGLPAIALTSLTGNLQKQAGLHAGFDYYEFKLDKPGLLKRVEEALQKRRAAK